MKRIAASLLLLCSCAAHATTLAYTANQGGGLIEFTDAPCVGGGLEADITDAGGQMVDRGCWTWSEPTIIARWASNGAVFYYNGANVTLTSEGKRLSKQKRANSM